MESIERELTYLAKETPKNLDKSKSILLMDIYFPATEENPMVRLRQKGDRYFLTKKEKLDETDASAHKEMTVEFTKEEFLPLSKIEGKRVIKHRYYYDYQGTTAEVDIFDEELAGLVLVEFEFPDQASYESFSIPDFCLADVTQEDFVAGGRLAGKSYADVQEDLERFGYESLTQSK